MGLKLICDFCGREIGLKPEIENLRMIDIIGPERKTQELTIGTTGKVKKVQGKDCDLLVCETCFRRFLIDYSKIETRKGELNGFQILKTLSSDMLDDFRPYDTAKGEQNDQN